MRTYRWMALAVGFVVATTAFSKPWDNNPAYGMDWETLQNHEIPDWFQDAKFGIYAHLGVYCVPSFKSEWYPRYMYIEGHEVQEHHEKTYGPLSEFGYHDFIPMFKLANFDADEWAELYKRAGAKFAGPVAEHHDGISMWDSDVNRWNTVDMGPRRDVVGELTTAIRKRDMKVITSFHHGFNIGEYFTEVPGTHTADPAYADLYGKFENPEEGYDRWLAKLVEVIDKYQPDQIWFDWCLREVPLEYRRRFASYYYSKEKEWGRNLIITRKLDQLPNGVGVLDHEGGSERDVTPYLWQTDQSVGGHYWSWRTGLETKSARSVLHELIRVVSKNGVMLLNVCPDSNGNIPGGQKEMLYEMGDWLKVNGEAIYGTRPWCVSGEGPRLYGHYGYYMWPCSAPQQNKVNLHYTTKGDTLYAICVNWPGEGFTFDKIQVKGAEKNATVSLLGHGEVEHEINDGKLTILPLDIKESDLPVPHAYVLKIENMDLQANPFSKLEVIRLHADNAAFTGHINIRKGNIKDNVKEENRIGYWSDQSDKIRWLVNVKKTGEYIVRAKMATRFRAADMALDNGEEVLKFSTEPRDKYGEPVEKDYGTIRFSKTGFQQIELRVEPMKDFPGVQGLWQIELAPLN